MKGRQVMRTTSIISIFALLALGASACKSSSPGGLKGGSPDESSESSGSEESNGGKGETTTVVNIDPGSAQFDPDSKDSLAQRKLDFNEALRTASLKLNRTLPSMKQIKHVQNASDKRAAYLEELDAMFEDVRFQERMIKWFQDMMRLGGGANNGKPSRNSAPVFAARVVAEGQPWSELFTAASNTCPTYDSEAHEFKDGDCQNKAPKVSGVLTDPGAMYQFYGSMAFRRVRWVQETFLCTKFPAEYAEKPVQMGAGDYTSPWKFESIGNDPIDFRDTQSVICANCHTTINHIAPLFATFDANGQWTDEIQVMTPTVPDPVKTKMSHWLVAGEKTHWRLGQEVADLAELGQAIAGDEAVAECAVARAYNYAFSKEDIVTDLATVPPSVLEKYVAEFEKNGQNLKKTMRAIFASDDFVRF